MSNALITIYGDSITKGVLMEGGRYLINSTGISALAQQFSLMIRNRSKFGCTIDKGLVRIRHDLEGTEAAPRVTVLEYGGNDSDFDWSKVAAEPDGEHQPKTPLDRFQELYKQAIDLVRSHGSEPVLMSLPPICPGRYLNWICREGLSRERILHWLGEENTIYRWQEMYSGAVALLAARLDLPLLDVRSRFLSRRDYTSLIARDGIHLTQAGYELIYDSFRETLPAMA